MTDPCSSPVQNPARGAIFQQLARIAHALATPARLALVSLLAHGEKSVDQLARATGQSLATTSAHLRVLRGACLVVSEKRGRQVFCRLAGSTVTRFWLQLRDLGFELLPEAREVVRQFLEAPELFAPTTPEELARELETGRVTLIDLRPADEFASGHLPGARNIPFASLASASADALEFGADGSVYAYCRGPYCMMGREGTARLRALGVRVRALRFSVPEWEASLPARPPLPSTLQPTRDQAPRPGPANLPEPI